MELITVRIPFKEGECHSVGFWGDWHLGNRACAKKELYRDREIIDNTPRMLYVNMGDNADYIARDDRRFKASELDPEILSIDNLDTLRDVLTDYVTEFEAPVIDKCIAQVNSNHPGKFDRLHHTNVMQEKLKRLRRPDLWCPGGAYIRLVYADAHRHTCQVFLNVHHGTKTSMYPATLLNRLLVKSRFWPEADIIARGHCHYRRSDHQERITSNGSHKKLKDSTVTVLLTGGYLKTFVEGGSNYAEDMDLDPIDIGMARVDIYPSRYGATIKAVT